MKPVPDIYCRFGKDRQVSELYTLKVDLRVALAIDFEPAYSLFIVLYSTFLSIEIVPVLSIDKYEIGAFIGEITEQLRLLYFKVVRKKLESDFLTLID